MSICAISAEVQESCSVYGNPAQLPEPNYVTRKTSLHLRKQASLIASDAGVG